MFSWFFLLIIVKVSFADLGITAIVGQCGEIEITGNL